MHLRPLRTDEVQILSESKDISSPKLMPETPLVVFNALRNNFIKSTDALVSRTWKDVVYFLGAITQTESGALFLTPLFQRVAGCSLTTQEIYNVFAEKSVYAQGSAAEHEIFMRGHDQGYQNGYMMGVEDSKNSGENSEIDDAYMTGYNKGYDDGSHSI